MGTGKTGKRHGGHDMPCEVHMQPKSAPLPHLWHANQRLCILNQFDSTHRQLFVERISCRYGFHGGGDALRIPGTRRHAASRRDCGFAGHRSSSIASLLSCRAVSGFRFDTLRCSPVRFACCRFSGQLNVPGTPLSPVRHGQDQRPGLRAQCGRWPGHSRDGRSSGPCRRSVPPGVRWSPWR